MMCISVSKSSCIAILKLFSTDSIQGHFRSILLHCLKNGSNRNAIVNRLMSRINHIQRLGRLWYNVTLQSFALSFQVYSGRPVENPQTLGVRVSRVQNPLEVLRENVFIVAVHIQGYKKPLVIGELEKGVEAVETTKWRKLDW